MKTINKMKRIYRMGENICKLYTQKAVNIHNIEETETTQQQFATQQQQQKEGKKEKKPDLKNGQRT